MAKLAIVTSSPPDTEGGHLIIARALVQAARDSGHDASLVVTDDFGFGRTFSTYLANWRKDVGKVDQVISLRYPSYAVRHQAHVCWLNHTMREYYDLWPAFERRLSLPNKVKEGLRRQVIHAADEWLLNRNVDRLFAQSDTIRRRLAGDFGLRADVLYPPPPQRAYRSDDYGEYIFAVSRLMPHKRVDLLVEALAEPDAQGVSAVVAGDGPARGELQSLAKRLGVDRRLTFLGSVDDETVLTHLARCRAVCFTPLSEDYGFVTAEAFASRKAVITCADSGGPAELVSEETGFVCQPTPAGVAAALGRLMSDRSLAERLGARAAARAASLRWDETIRKLLLRAES